MTCVYSFADGTIITGRPALKDYLAQPGVLESLLPEHAARIPAFKRTPVQAAVARAVNPEQTAMVERMAKGITARWANPPEVVVFTDMQDQRIPQEVRDEDARQKSGGANGEPEGFYYKGVAYLNAAEITTPQDSARVLFHEGLGHYGLRGVFGQTLKSELEQIVALRKSDVLAKAKQYGLDANNPAHLLEAAEEVLATMAQTNPSIGFVKRAVAAIRTWLRKNVPGMANLELSDAEIIRDYIIPARRFVETGLTRAQQNDADVQAFIKSAKRASSEEKQSDPATWTKEQRTAYDAGDWRKFSELRGYTKDEIANYGEFMRLADVLNKRYGEGYAQDLSHGIDEGVRFSRSNNDMRLASPPGWSNIEPEYEREQLQILNDTQSREDIALLEKRIDTARDKFSASEEHPYRAVRLRNADALAGIGNAFGVRVVGFDVDPKLLGGQKYNFFSGVTFKRTGNAVYLNAETNRPHLAILGHETAHQMAARRPDIYKELVEAIRPYVDQKKYADDFANSAVARNVESMEGKREEFIGEVMSDAFMDPLFWNTLGKENPSLLKKVYNFVMDILRKVAAAGSYSKQAAPYLTDYDRVMQLAASAMAQYGMDPGEIAKTSLFGFSFAEKDTDFAEKPTDTGLTPPEQGLLRRVQAAVQDNMNRVRQVQERIEKLIGKPLPDYADYYGAETNRPGRIAARLEDFQKQMTGPLMAKLAKSGHTQEQLSELLHAMHAQERNEAVAKINPDMPDGGSGMTNAEAAAILSKYRTNRELHSMANEAREITKATLELKLAYGLIDIETFTTLADRYSNYVPLKGDGEYGPKIKRAMGHDERDEHILENIARDYELAVVAGEKNLARQSLLSMVLQNPDSDLWTVGVPPKGRYVAGTVYSVRQGKTEVATFTSNSQVSAFLEGKGSQAGQYEVWAGGERVREFAKPLQDNEVMVYVDGKPVRIQIVGDEQLARQLRPLDQARMNPILEFMRSVNRYLSKIYTGYNPAFIIKNTARDAMTGTINIMGNEGAGTAARAWANYPAAMKALSVYAATGKVPTGEAGKMLDEYRQFGGKTGASYMSDLEEQGKTLQRMFDDAYGATGYLADKRLGKSAAVAGRKIVGGMAHVIEVMNQATENGLRLALYMAMRNQGVSPGEAAQAAKSVTVDFDRKGSQSGVLGAIFLFFNPAVQGTANAIKTLAKGDNKAQAWAALGALAVLGAYAAGQGMDDDKDKWLGEGWESRAKNLILKIGGMRLKVPLSMEFAPFYALGIAMAEAKRGEGKMKAAGHIVSSFIDAYFPLQGAFNSESDNHGMDAAMATVPTVLKPGVQIAANRNSFGSPVVPDSELTKDRPDNLKMFKGTKGSVYDAAAQGIATVGQAMGAGKYENDITKVSPETLKMLWRTYTGGLGQFVTDMAGLANVSAQAPGTTEIADVPILKDFVKSGDDVRPIRSRFYELTKEARAASEEFKQAKKAGDGEAMDAIMDRPEKAELLGFDRLIRSTTKAAGELRDAMVDINADQSLSLAEKRVRLKELEKEEEAIYRDAIAAFR
jgi:hypothetical protein